MDLFDPPNRDARLSAILREHSRAVYRGVLLNNDYVHIYNFPVINDDLGPDVIAGYMDYIYNLERDSSYKVTLSASYILEDITSNEYRWYYGHDNSLFYPTPMLITNAHDLRRVIRRLNSADIMNNIYNTRPQSSYVVRKIVTCRVKVVKLRSVPLGAGPGQVRHSQVCPFPVARAKSSTPPDDYLCVFRALAAVRHKKFDGTRSGLPTLRRSNSVCKRLLARWLKAIGCKDPDQFRGVQTSDLPLFEKVFKVKVTCFAPLDGGAVLLYRSRYDSAEEPRRHSHLRAMALYVEDSHASLILNVTKFKGTFRCRHCDTLFAHTGHLKRHEAACLPLQGLKMKGGILTGQRTLISQFKRFGVPFHPDLETQYCKHFVTYDFECLLVKSSTLDMGHSTTLTATHRPVSVACSTNLPGYSGECAFFCNPDPMLLMTDFVTYLRDLQRVFREHYSRLYSAQLTYIKDKMAEIASTPLYPDSVYRSDKHKAVVRNRYARLLATLTNYVSRLPVLSYNGSGYDIKVARPYLFTCLGLARDETKTRIIRQSGAYTLISTNEFLFLDIFRFMGGVGSYEAFLKCWEVQGTEKFFLPYDWFTCPSLLDYPRVPDYSCWYSILKGVNLLQVKLGAVRSSLPKYDNDLLETLYRLGHLTMTDRDAARTHVTNPHECHSALVKAGVGRKLPLTGLEEYCDLLLLWRRNGWTSFRSHLREYNIKDVHGFLIGVERLLHYFNSMSPRLLDPLKQAISAPGLARKLLFTSMPPNTYFYLLDQKRQHVFDTFKANLAGGLSMIFHRLAIKDETYVRNGQRPVKSILGFDCNSLYAYCLKQKLPTGRLTIRQPDDGFRPFTPSLYSASEEAAIYMDWMARRLGVKILHYFNSGEEFQVDVFPVDGKVDGQNWVIQYYGCNFHFCTKCGYDNPKVNEWDRFVVAYIESKGYRVTTLWSHEFRDLQRSDPDFKAFVKLHRRPRHHPRGFPSIPDILAAVMDGSLFGALVVDLHVPVNDRPYWEEYPPLVLNCQLPFDMWGEHMQAHVKRHNLSRSPRTLLTSGFVGVKVLIITDLLKYYIQMGLQVTKVYEIFEFEGGFPFVNFIDRLTELRRQGDRCEDKAILGSLAKLLCNSAYGSLLLDPLRTRTVEIIDAASSSKTLFERLKHRNFRDLTSVDDNDLYEVHSLPNTITVNTPYYVGVFVLQLAKLRQLEFIYQVLVKFIPRDTWNLLSCDTDSAYLSLASHNLPSLVPSHLRASFKKIHPDMFVTDYCPRHKDLYFDLFFAGRDKEFIPCDECRDTSLFTKRTLGLYKLEAKGDYFIALCSKCYVLVDSSSHTTKCVAKGVQLSQVRDPFPYYYNALFEGARQTVTNRGFRSHEGHVRSYTVSKYAFSYFYVKRIVQSDGISTTSIPGLILTPVTQQST